MSSLPSPSRLASETFTLVYTHALPFRLCAHADDKNNNAVQRAVQDELRHVLRLHAVEFEETVNSVACETCKSPGRHIIQMPLPVLDMPVSTVGVTVMRVCEKLKCASAIQESTTDTTQEMRDIFSPMFGQQSPPLSMLRRDSCGERKKPKQCPGSERSML